MPKQEFMEDFIKLISAITNKRAKIVIEHIIEHGFITTRDLETTYGYSHPPRAARDVRERSRLNQMKVNQLLLINLETLIKSNIIELKEGYFFQRNLNTNFTL